MIHIRVHLNPIPHRTLLLRARAVPSGAPTRDYTGLKLQPRAGEGAAPQDRPRQSRIGGLLSVGAMEGPRGRMYEDIFR